MATVPPPIVVKTASPQDFALVTAMRQTRISHNFEDQDVSNHRGLSYQLSKLTKWNSSQPIVLWPLGIGLRSRDRWFTLGARGKSTHTRVLYLSVLSMLILVSFAVWQVLYLRRYFKSKKLIE
ncbi:hypothetical protein X801_05309 [Opisthorchis viverrini]|uniref:GOLD domain-containing protein n=1 Tax=Opisthorchis viverrini TaxID=6198 RepID=A0A1S8WWM4_OPIVI|nr:hypothetical protein X801_05309 [Opisthorchis viverrini]